IYLNSPLGCPQLRPGKQLQPHTHNRGIDQLDVLAFDLFNAFILRSLPKEPRKMLQKSQIQPLEDPPVPFGVAVAHRRFGRALLEADIFEKFWADADDLSDLPEGMAFIQLPGIIATS